MFDSDGTIRTLPTVFLGSRLIILDSASAVDSSYKLLKSDEGCFALVNDETS